MGNVVLILVVWFVISFPVALIVGRVLAASNREMPEIDEETLPEEPYFAALSPRDNGS